MGFKSTNGNPPQALCFFCGEKLANSSMKPVNLQRHLNTKHLCHVGKPPEYRSSQEMMRKASTTSAKALEASDLKLLNS
ncbi:hypothetical protein NQZ68_019385, partial [Dissostichus eleginoides]